MLQEMAVNFVWLIIIIVKLAAIMVGPEVLLMGVGVLAYEVLKPKGWPTSLQAVASVVIVIALLIFLPRNTHG